jgi:hypothetical protein
MDLNALNVVALVGLVYGIAYGENIRDVVAGFHAIYTLFYIVKTVTNKHTSPVRGLLRQLIIAICYTIEYTWIWRYFYFSTFILTALFIT